MVNRITAKAYAGKVRLHLQSLHAVLSWHESVTENGIMRKHHQPIEMKES